MYIDKIDRIHSGDFLKLRIIILNKVLCSFFALPLIFLTGIVFS